MDVHQVVLALYQRARTRNLAIRLLGVALSKLCLVEDQLELFDGKTRRSAAVDRVRAKFGYDAVHLASTVARRKRA